MIKIIKKGKTKWKETCRNCECVFTYEKEDIISPKSKSNPAASLFDRVKCPCCGSEILI